MIWGSDSTRGKVLSLHKEQEWFCGPPSLLFSGYQGIVPWGKVADAGGWPFTSIECWGWEWVEL